ncbi:putative insulin-like peptide alpha-type 3 [Caenorhabditis elegans]|uniref:Probable insulin-like peptide alpha-type 3 n=1 Tax=Caenorhabditis elegans TaxID=6239 RepID=ILA3_CAEEL|nr:putative insulin-like peptide alpha-type 3 [Caenorhabditis elegans]Q21506.1 RecName: Full=Probable insulin-like peptide alpha-type 3; Flags: Precursor [Caenorhabditis elegans]CAA83609.1 Probable insulin-like peptide alpha-type 3 [Caenorhabditis elegans]|eukprot:NP_499224.1 Probable insulin-like peptide alpha-type 3 [Caenorhabditis elegans]
MFVLLIILSIILAQVTDAHSELHVRRVCGTAIIKNIMRLCPGVPACENGEVPSPTEYCSMGYSDSQVKYLCCPTSQ